MQRHRVPAPLSGPCRVLLSLLMAVALRAAIAQAASEPETAGAPQPPDAALELAQTAEGRQLLEYAAGCALAEGESLTFEIENQRYRFPGGLGLAREWLKRPLTPTDERWVSACLLARTNAFGIKIQISLHGAHKALQTSVQPAETQRFIVDEAAFYGNIFASPAVAYVCQGEQALPASDLTDRVCGELSDTPPLTQCRFVLTGRCRDVCEYQDDHDGHYGRCRGPEGLYSEVVTVFLKTEL